MRNKTIGIDLTSLADNFSGLERVALEITKSMIKNHGYNFVLFFRNDIYPYFINNPQENVSYYVIKGSRIKTLLFFLSKAIKKTKPDYFFFSAFPPSPFFRKVKSVKYFSEIADLVCWDCPETMKLKSKLFFRMGIIKAIKISTKIFTVSLFTKDRLIKRFNIEEKKIVVASPSSNISDSVKYVNLSSKYQIPKEYLLLLSTIEPRKNLKETISWIAKSWKKNIKIPDIVIGGRKGWKTDDLLENLSESEKSRVHFTGFIDDEDLPSLYHNSEMLVFPSKYEGFGIPIVEAIKSGTLVLCSDIPTSREILPNYLYFYSLNSFDDFYDKLTRLLEIKDRKEVILKEKDEIKRFSWDKSGDVILEAMTNEHK